jgi:hypothetical protein
VGATSRDGFDASAAADVHRLGGTDRPNDGTEGRVSARPEFRNPDDSVLYQSRRKEPQRAAARRARASEAHSSAASRQTEGRRQKALNDEQGRGHTRETRSTPHGTHVAMGEFWVAGKRVDRNAYSVPIRWSSSPAARGSKAISGVAAVEVALLGFPIELSAR